MLVDLLQHFLSGSVVVPKSSYGGLPVQFCDLLLFCVKVKETPGACRGVRWTISTGISILQTSEDLRLNSFRIFQFPEELDTLSILPAVVFYVNGLSRSFKEI
jgi:hypothetical protein